MGCGVSRAGDASTGRWPRALRRAGAGVVVATGLIAFLPTAAAAPPANDAFAAALPIADASGSVSGTNVEATKEPGEPNHADDPGGHSVWYRWTAPATGQVLFETCAAGAIDTLLAVYTGTAVSALTRVAANDDSCGVQSSVIFTARAGTVYSIAVDGFEAEAGAFTLRWTNVTTPANDAFSAAQPITGERGSVQGTTLGAGSEIGERQHAGISTGASVWYSWAPPFTGGAGFNTCGSPFDTVLGVYTGASVNALALQAANDDACQLQSRVRFRAQAGTTYRIVVDSADETRGPFTLSWLLARRPANDDYAAARRIRGARGSVNGTNVGALAEARERGHAPEVPPSASMWYRWRAPATMGVVFETCGGATFDTVLGIYRGATLRRAARLDGNDDACPRERSRLAFPARRGVEYRIVLDGYRGDTGTFRIAWRRVSPSARLCRVPEVRGQTLGRARIVLERADCVLGRIEYARSGIVPRGRIISQFPRPGVRIGMFAGVNVEVSRGR